jgi:transposase
MRKLESEIDKLLEMDVGVKGLRSVPELGRKTVAVLRAELGNVTRFQHTDQVVAYAGMDIEVKEIGKWKGQDRLSKRAVGGFGASCIWRRCAVYAGPILPLGRTITGCWLVG